jgi:hypothetical protein
MTKVTIIDAICVCGAAVLALMALVEFSSNDGDRAKDAYEAAKNSGASGSQLCRSAKAVEEAYRAAKDASNAEQWSLYARIDCSGAFFNEGYNYQN